MSVRIEMAPDWLAHLREAEQVFLEDRLGPDILDDARRYVPVDTGRLQASLDYTVDGGAGGVPELQVGSFPDADGAVPYALAVEFGFHGEEVVRAHMRRSRSGGEHPVREHTRHGNTPEQPYLRPALYQERY
jgi:hypothetical protein